jgi:hypothetical protein
MGHKFANRRAAGAVVTALALGIAAPAAGATPMNLNTAGSEVPAGSIQTQPTVTSHDPGGNISDWGAVAISAGTASVTLVSIGGTRAATRRRQRQRAAYPRSVA